MDEEGVKQQQKLQRMMKEEKEEASPVLQKLRFHPELLESHNVQSGMSGRRWEINPTGPE